MNSFTSTNGQTYNFLPGYRQSHPKLRVGGMGEILTEATYNPAGKKPIKYGAFAKDTLLYSMMADAFRNRNLDLRNERFLEVGGAEGAVARLAKTDGFAKYSQVVELFDMQPLLPDATYFGHLRRHRLYSTLRKLGHRRRGDRPELFIAQDYWPGTSDSYFNIRNRGNGLIDEYTIRNYYDLTGQYDFISSQCAMDYFVPPDFFKKAAELIPPGGHMYVYVAYWWNIVNMTYTVGDFPYLAQRLPREDVLRFFEENHPAEKDTFQRYYDYYHVGSMKPVLDDYLEMADEAGFEVLASRRHMPQGPTKRNTITPEMLNEDPDYQLRDILKDVQKIAPKVRLADLKTSHVMMTLRRRDVSRGALAKRLNSPM